MDNGSSCLRELAPDFGMIVTALLVVEGFIILAIMSLAIVVIIRFVQLTAHEQIIIMTGDGPPIIRALILGLHDNEARLLLLQVTLGLINEVDL